MKRLISTVLVVSMLAVICGCEEDEKTNYTTVQSGGIPVYLTTVSHDGHRFIVVVNSGPNTGGVAVIRHPDDGKAEKETGQ